MPKSMRIRQKVFILCKIASVTSKYIEQTLRTVYTLASVIYTFILGQSSHSDGIAIIGKNRSK